ncbi:MAG: HlyC/CorC family transporter [Anaerolineae bacterium]|nr:HlyC/CorC family transporter [Anaerolineae bacterium]
MEILIVLALILLNGLFALAEIAVIAARPARLQERAYQGEQGALDALKLQEAPNRFLSTIQIGITLIGTLAGAFGGASVAEDLAPLLGQIPFLEPYASALSVGLVVVLITYCSLVLGELTPKRLGLTRPEDLAIRLAPWMVRLSVWTRPVVVVLTASTEAVLSLFGIRQEDTPPVTDEEIRLLMMQGAQAGVFAPLESEMVEGVLRMGDQRSRAVMTPRHEIVWLDVTDSIEENLEKVRESGYSRFLVCRGALDNVLGLAYAKDLLARYLSGQAIDLTKGLRQPIYVPETMPALDILTRFRKSRVHVALVLDEYGGVEGLITLRDLLESIVGQLMSAGEVTGPTVVARADGSWLVDGDYPVDGLESLLSVRELPARERAGYETVAGMVLLLFDRIPKRGEHVIWEGWKFEVVDMDGLRIDQVLIHPRSQDETLAS